jgi:hypothetical protein
VLRHETAVIAVVAPLALLVPAIASADTLRLICAYSQFADDNGKVSPSSGEDLFTVEHSGVGKALIKKEGLEAVFEGTISETEIRGDARYEMEGMTFVQRLVINRFTGSMTLTFAGKRGGLVHFGRCRKAGEKLF